jgi:hypothetical protein
MRPSSGRANVGHEQDRVARGLVDLDAVPVHQVLVLERVSIDASRSDVQGQPARVEHELVLLPRLVHPAQPALERQLDAGAAVLVRDEVVGGEEAEPSAYERMLVDGVVEDHGQLDLLLHQLESLQFGLPAAQVERRQDLVVRRGRGVRHVRLVECLLVAVVEVLVEDVDHRALPERGQRLVRRLGGVDADPHLLRIRHQAGRQQRLVAVAGRRLQVGLGRGVPLAIGRVPVTVP